MSEREDLAIIGISCRVPDANNYRELWKNLCEGKESIKNFSDKELEAFGVPEEKRKHPRYIARGATAENIDCFDAPFFDYSPSQASKLDPQHRFFLECCWEAMEDAGYANPEKKQNVAVYAGFGSLLSSYALAYRTARPEIEGMTIGNELFSLDRDYGATRVSYKLNLTGPAINVQCACSTSLVAVHLACRSILDGESEMALAGGATIHPLSYIGYLQESGGPESEDGHVRTFDESSNGTVFGRGTGVVLIKKLSAALKDNDHIYAVIKSTAINNDGSLKDSYASPSIEGQVACMIEAIESAKINPETISYVLAHGTATLVGDPIEAQSLAQAFQRWTSKKQYCVIGAIKPNLSHLDSAAGIMNLIVSALSLYYKKIPPLINFKSPNPKIDFENSPFYIATECKEYPTNIPNRVLTTAFGVGGTNACAILEEAPPRQQDSNLNLPSNILLFSAKNNEALIRELNHFKTFLSDSHENLKNIAYTLATARFHFPIRKAIVATSLQNAVEKIQNIEIEETINRNHKIAFVFSGQGSQYSRMTKELYDLHPLFKQWIDKANKILKSYLEDSLLNLLFNADDQIIADTRITQPLLFAIEFALYKLYESWGIKPHYVLGHSLGEYVAATVAGAMSFEEGLKLVAERGKLIGTLPPEGAMAAILTSANEVENQLNENLKTRINIAGYNGVNQTVVAGKQEDVEKFIKQFKVKNIHVALLPVSHAFHSYLLNPILEPFEQKAKQINYQKLTIPLICNLSGEEINNISAEYWVKHLRSPVQFVNSIKKLEELNCDIILEIGPHPILLNSLKESVNADKKYHFIPTLKKKSSDWEQILQTLASLYQLNIPINWQAFYEPFKGLKVSLPTYPFEKKRYWIEPSNENGYYGPKTPFIFASKLSPLLDKKIENALGIDLYQTDLKLKNEDQKYIQDHIILDDILFPAAGFVEILAEVANQSFPSKPFSIENILISTALPLKTDQTKTIQVILEKNNEQQEVSIHSYKHENSWLKHVNALIQEINPLNEKIKLNSNLSLSRDEVLINKLYETLKSEGAHYGSYFRPTQNFIIENETIWAYLKLLGKDGELIHPSHFDAALQLSNYLANQINKNWSQKIDTVSLPTKIDSINFLKPIPLEAIAHIYNLRFSDEKNLECDFDVFNLEEDLCLRVKGATLTKTNKKDFIKNLHKKNLIQSFYVDDWDEKALIKIDPIQVSNYCFISDRTSLLFNNLEQLILKLGNKVFWVNDENEIINDNLKDKEKILFDFTTDNNAELEENQITQIIQTKLKKFYEFIKKIINEGQFPNIYVITNGVWSQFPKSACAISPIVGFRRGLIHEIPNLFFSIIDIDPSTDLQQAIPNIVNEVLHTNEDKEIRIISNKRFVSRLVSYSDWIKKFDILSFPIDNYFRLSKGSSQSSLDHLSFQNYSSTILKENEVELSIRSVGLNFRDLLNAMNLYPGEAGLLGTDCVGVVTKIGLNVSNCKKGDLVFGFANGSLGDYTTTNSDLITHLPTGMLIPEAASLPTIFLTAYYALIHLAKLKKGDRVLIHAAAGGVGLAAIQIAKNVGAEIFATCSSDLKKEYLQTLGIIHIYNSRNLKFANEILADTHNEGVNVILNSLSGEGFIATSISCLKKDGNFLEIGKRNIWSKDEMYQARPDVKYSIIALDEMIQNNSTYIQELLKEVVGYFDKKIYQPINYVVFPLTRIKEALRYLQTAKQIGKVVVEVPPPWQKNIREDKFYLITGGLGGIGLTMAEWLIDQGAKKIILVSRRSPSQEIEERISQWKTKDIEILIESLDVSNQESILRLFDRLKKLNLEISGILHTAGLLHVDLIQNTNWSDIEKVFAAKIYGSFYLSQAILEKNINLDFFIHFSSNSSITGAPGQLGYCGANSFVDCFARYQMNLGIPIVSLNWSLWSQVGMGLNFHEFSLNAGYTLIEPKSSYSIIDFALNNQLVNVCIMDVNWNIYLNKVGHEDSRLKNLKLKMEVKKDEKGTELISLLQNNSKSEWLSILENTIKTNLSLVLGISKDNIQSDMSFTQLGLDSLARNEFIAKLEKAILYKKRFNFTFLNTYPNVKSFSSFLSEELSNVIDVKNNVTVPVDEKLNLKENELNKLELNNYIWVPLDEQSWKPLSYNLEFLWIIINAGRKDQNPNLTTRVQFDSIINAEIFEKAVNIFLSNQPIFYIKFAKIQPLYKIHPFIPLKLKYKKIEKSDFEKDIVEEVQKFSKKVLDINLFPHLDILLIALPNNKTTIVFKTSQMIIDTYSLGLIVKEILNNYEALLNNKRIAGFKNDFNFINKITEINSETDKILSNEKNKFLEYQINYKSILFKKDLIFSNKNDKELLIINIHSEQIKKIEAVSKYYNLASTKIIELFVSLAITQNITEQDYCSVHSLDFGRNSTSNFEIIGNFATSQFYTLNFKNRNLKILISELTKNYNHYQAIKTLAGGLSFSNDDGKRNLSFKSLKFFIKSILIFILPKRKNLEIFINHYGSIMANGILQDSSTRSKKIGHIICNFLSPKPFEFLKLPYAYELFNEENFKLNLPQESNSNIINVMGVPELNNNYIIAIKTPFDLKVDKKIKNDFIQIINDFTQLDTTRVT